MPIAVPNPAPKKKRSMLPVLTVVFILSYGLMTMLIVEQGGVIQQQRNLIQVLQTDSAELWAMKGKAIVDKANRPKGHNPANTPEAENPGASKKAQTPQQRSQVQAGEETKQHIQLPPVPASDLGDNRRVLITL
jgi:uncharacterized membrane protein